jgi:hypothetical protein
MLRLSRLRCVGSFELQLDSLVGLCTRTYMADHKFTHFRRAPCISEECLYLQADARIVIRLVHRYKFSHFQFEYWSRDASFEFLRRVCSAGVRYTFICAGERKVSWAGMRSRYRDWLRAGWSSDRIAVAARFPHLSRQALGPTQPPIQWVPAFFRG